MKRSMLNVATFSFKLIFNFQGMKGDSKFPHGWIQVSIRFFNWSSPKILYIFLLYSVYRSKVPCRTSSPKSHPPSCTRLAWETEEIWLCKALHSNIIQFSRNLKAVGALIHLSKLMPISNRQTRTLTAWQIHQTLVALPDILNVPVPLRKNHTWITTTQPNPLTPRV